MLSDHRLRTLIGLLVTMLMPPGFAQAQDTKTPGPNGALCIECLKIRVGLPRVVRGPPGIGIDGTFNEIKLPNGRFRGFFPAGSSYAIDGDAPWAMGGPAVTVLKPGVLGSMAGCGQWLQHVEPAGKTLLGWVHQETACNYKNHLQTHMSLSLATSTDNGLTWQIKGFIITGKENDKPADGLATGETCFSAVDGEDGYYYASCARSRDGLRYVARAPISNPGPGNWKKYFNGAWSQPGVGGDASRWPQGIATGGHFNNIANWPTVHEMVGIIYQWRTRAPGDKTPQPGALHLGFSQDHFNFTVLRDPLILVDGGGWARPNPYELLDYPSLLDGHTGSNQLSGSQWNLFYMDIQPNESFDKRYLVARPIDVARSRQGDEPQVGVMLGHWHNAARREHWSTIAAVPGNYTDYKLEAQSGYLMTVADAKRPSVELEDCVSQQGAHLDHVLMPRDTCEGRGYQRQRTVGWVFSTPQPGTQPLYGCYSEAEKSHFAASSEDCEHAGKMETLLGYVLEASPHEGTHQIVSQATGLCFNIRGNTNNSGEAIIPYPCGGSTNMEFSFVDQGSSFYSIHTVNGTQDLCLNISTAASSPGDGKKYGDPGNVIQSGCTGSSLSDSELFKLVDLGGGRQQIRVKNSGLCLEDPGRGGTIRQNVCSSSLNQTFRLRARP